MVLFTWAGNLCGNMALFGRIWAAVTVVTCIVLAVFVGARDASIRPNSPRPGRRAADDPCRSHGRPVQGRGPNRVTSRLRAERHRRARAGAADRRTDHDDSRLRRQRPDRPLKGFSARLDLGGSDGRAAGGLARPRESDTDLQTLLDGRLLFPSIRTPPPARHRFRPSGMAPSGRCGRPP